MESIIRVPAVNSEVICVGSDLGLWRDLGGRERCQDSEAAGESLWDGQGVEI